MFVSKLRIVIIAIISVVLLSGFGLGDLKDNLKPKTEKCDDAKNKSSCKNKEKIKSAAKIIAIGVAAKIAYDMVIKYNTKITSGEEKISKAYIKENNTLPDAPKVTVYTSSIRPGQVVKVGKPVGVASNLEVVPGKNSKKVKIQERIEIYDNEDNKKIIRSLVKTVNGKTGQAGAFENNFSFTLPVGMPQGVYPIKTAVLINDKEFNSANNDMQVVMHVLPNNQYQIASAH